MVVDPARRPRRPRTAGRRRRETLSVRIDPDLRRNIRIWAAFRNQEISDLVENAVASHLDALAEERAAQGLKPIPAPDEKADDAGPREGGDA